MPPKELAGFEEAFAAERGFVTDFGGVALWCFLEDSSGTSRGALVGGGSDAALGAALHRRTTTSMVPTFSRKSELSRGALFAET